jgi:DNA-binding MurR/RpiR family transcriptional regulator
MMEVIASLTPLMSFVSSTELVISVTRHASSTLRIVQGLQEHGLPVISIS